MKQEAAGRGRDLGRVSKQVPGSCTAEDAAPERVARRPDIEAPGDD
jgi:hypothetical protein